MMRNILFLLALFSATPFAQQNSDFNPRMKPLDLNVADAKRAHYEKYGYIALGESVRDDTLRKGIYVATRNVTVPPGGRVEVLSGVNILFEPGVRLIVDGALSATGPCQFRNIPSSNLYDKSSSTEWGGMTVGPSGSLVLKDVGIGGSGRGIVVVDTCEFLSLTNVSFDFVTSPWVRVKDSDVEQKNPVSFQYPTMSLKPKGDTATKSPNKTVSKPARALRFVSAGVAIAGVGVAAIGLYTYAHNLSLYESSNDPSKNTPDEVVKYKRDAKNGRTMAIVGGAVAALGLVGCTLTFVF